MLDKVFNKRVICTCVDDLAVPECEMINFIYVTVPEKRDLIEASFILRYKPFKNVRYIETNINFKLHMTISLDWTGLCSCFIVHFVELIVEKKKMYISQF